jgi:hypothetical protein
LYAIATTNRHNKHKVRACGMKMLKDKNSHVLH